MGGGGVADDLVVDIRYVHDLLDLTPLLLEKAAQHVHLQEGAKVADVPVIVDRGPANINAQRLTIRWFEIFDSISECVEEADGHPGCGNYLILMVTSRANSVHQERAGWNPGGYAASAAAAAPRKWTFLSNGG